MTSSRIIAQPLPLRDTKTTRSVTRARHRDAGCGDAPSPPAGAGDILQLLLAQHPQDGAAMSCGLLGPSINWLARAHALFVHVHVHAARQRVLPRLCRRGP